jgi:hypothetical protein
MLGISEEAIRTVLYMAFALLLIFGVIAVLLVFRLIEFPKIGLIEFLTSLFAKLLHR